ETGEYLDLHVMINMSDHNIEMDIPPIRNRCWNLAIDTFKSSPEDALLPEEQQHWKRKTYTVEAKSVVILESSLRKWWMF
ncbi:MAG: hypothetical protein RQ715_11780, partial [Methylococcales bacterium]|nr:hypothetical protein [Methylococcales bacterium]